MPNKIKEYTINTAVGIGPDGAVIIYDWNGNSGDNKYLVPYNSSMKLTIYSDDTLSITGKVVDINDPSAILDVNVVCENPVNGSEWGGGFNISPGENPNTDLWTIYSNFSSTQATLTGEGGWAAGLTIPIILSEDGYFGFQVGNAANNRNGNYGAGSWFGSTSGSNFNQGDFFFDLVNPVEYNYPTNISLSTTEFLADATEIATISTTDSYTTNFTYSLVHEGAHVYFTITDNKIYLNPSEFNDRWGIVSNFPIKIKITDPNNNSFEKEFTLTALTKIVLSSTTLDENIPAGSVVATLSGSIYSYNLDSDTYFTIDGNQLKIKDSPDRETKSSYTVTIDSVDTAGQSFNDTFTLTVNNVLEYTKNDGTTATFSSSTYTGVDLGPGVDLAEGNLSGAILTDANLSGAYLLGNLDTINLSGANLSGANLTDVTIHFVNLTDANLTDAKLIRINSIDNLIRVNLSRADLTDAQLLVCSIEQTNLTDANLSGADLTSGSIHYTDLSGANLSGANLSAVWIDYSNLSGANLSGANLSSAYLDIVNLSGANLSSANLSGATLNFAGESATLAPGSTAPLNIPSGFNFTIYDGQSILDKTDSCDDLINAIVGDAKTKLQSLKRSGNSKADIKNNVKELLSAMKSSGSYGSKNTDEKKALGKAVLCKGIKRARDISQKSFEIPSVEFTDDILNNLSEEKKNKIKKSTNIRILDKSNSVSDIVFTIDDQNLDPFYCDELKSNGDSLRGNVYGNTIKFTRIATSDTIEVEIESASETTPATIEGGSTVTDNTVIKVANKIISLFEGSVGGTIGETIDLNGDGVSDGVLVDTNGDGFVDGIDTNGDGVSNGDLVDTNFDGTPNGVIYNDNTIDINGDGVSDGVVFDAQSDGIFEVDENGDGVPDGFIAEYSGDGLLDYMTNTQITQNLQWQNDSGNTVTDPIPYLKDSEKAPTNNKSDIKFKSG